jgi:hypothetical protein
MGHGAWGFEEGEREKGKGKSPLPIAHTQCQMSMPNFEQLVEKR